MRSSLMTLLVACSVATACGHEQTAQTNDARGASSAQPTPRQAPATAAERLEGSSRCRGTKEGEPLIGQAGEILSRALLERTDLPAGWETASPAVAPPPDDPLFVVASAAWQPFCASARDYDTPKGRVHVVVAVFPDETAAREAAARMNSARLPDTTPPILALRHVTLISPGDRATAEAWAAAGNVRSGARDVDLLARAAELGDAAAFQRLFDARVLENPSDAMPWAYKAGLEATKGDFDSAKASASAALARAASDPEAQAEALHWASYAEYASGTDNATVRALTERGVVAARTAGNESMLMRALFDRGCSLSIGGETRRALEDVMESLAIEAKLGGSYYRDAARTDADLEAARQLPEMRQLLKE